MTALLESDIFIPVREKYITRQINLICWEELVMKKSKVKFTIIQGVVVVLLLAASGWYSILFNDWRLEIGRAHV